MFTRKTEGYSLAKATKELDCIIAKSEGAPLLYEVVDLIESRLASLRYRQAITISLTTTPRNTVIGR